MASMKIPGIGKFGCVMCLSGAPLLSYTVYAAGKSKEDETKIEPQTQKVKIKQLPIYDMKHIEARYYYEEEKINAVRKVVHDIRVGLWKIHSQFESQWGPVRSILQKGYCHTVGFIEYVQNDPSILPRAGVITVAGLGGIVAGYRGGIVRKVFLSASAMGAATALCYPKETVTITQNGYKYVADHVTGLSKGKLLLKKKDDCVCKKQD